MALRGRVHLIIETLGIRGTRRVVIGPSGLGDHVFYLLFLPWTLPLLFPSLRDRLRKRIDVHSVLDALLLFRSPHVVMFAVQRHAIRHNAMRVSSAFLRIRAANICIPPYDDHEPKGRPKASFRPICRHYRVVPLGAAAVGDSRWLESLTIQGTGERRYIPTQPLNADTSLN